MDMEQKSQEAHDKIFRLLFSKEDEITWQTIIYELVKSEEMDPWDIEIGNLTQKYIEMLRSLREHDFRISGKVLLAAAILLKIKSTKLVGEELNELDKLLIGVEEEMDSLGFEEQARMVEKLDTIPPLIPRTPQPRKRKVSIFDLVDALERALEVKKRRVWQSMPQHMEAPKKKRDITQVIKDVYGKIRLFFVGTVKNGLTFTKLLPSESREDKVYTFIPLLHLAQQNKIELEQKEPFGEISIILKRKEEAPAVEEEGEGEESKA
jgi:segregation and condensation protein A